DLGAGDRGSQEGRREDDAGGICGRRCDDPLPVERGSGDGVRRYHARRAGAESARTKSVRLAEYVSHVAADSGGGVYTGAAGTHPVDREIREVHGGLGRAGHAAEFAIDDDEPDRESAGRSEEHTSELQSLTNLVC